MEKKMKEERVHNSNTQQRIHDTRIGSCAFVSFTGDLIMIQYINHRRFIPGSRPSDTPCMPASNIVEKKGVTALYVKV